MAIIAPQTTDNCVPVEYHRILSVNLLCSPDEPVPRWHYIIGTYYSAYARDVCPGRPVESRSIFVPIQSIIDAGGVDPRVLMYEQIMASPDFVGTNAYSDVQPVTDDPASGSRPDADGSTSATTG